LQEQSALYGLPNFIYRGLYDPLGFAYADNDANPTNWRADGVVRHRRRTT